MATEPPLTVHVPRDELPVTCPRDKAKWNLHPRVYLPLAPGSTQTRCPYCGTVYVVVDAPASTKSHKDA